MFDSINVNLKASSTHTKRELDKLVKMYIKSCFKIDIALYLVVNWFGKFKVCTV